jgi:hypothetical protein
MRLEGRLGRPAPSLGKPGSLTPGIATRLQARLRHGTRVPRGKRKAAGGAALLAYPVSHACADTVTDLSQNGYSKNQRKSPPGPRPDWCWCRSLGPAGAGAPKIWRGRGSPQAVPLPGLSTAPQMLKPWLAPPSHKQLYGLGTRSLAHAHKVWGLPPPQTPRLILGGPPRWRAAALLSPRGSRNPAAKG